MLSEVKINKRSFTFCRFLCFPV